jgi:hypothetical protein
MASAGAASLVPENVAWRSIKTMHIPHHGRSPHHKRVHARLPTRYGA